MSPPPLFNFRFPIFNFQSFDGLILEQLLQPPPERHVLYHSPPLLSIAKSAFLKSFFRPTGTLNTLLYKEMRYSARWSIRLPQKFFRGRKKLTAEDPKVGLHELHELHESYEFGWVWGHFYQWNSCHSWTLFKVEQASLW